MTFKEYADQRKILIKYLLKKVEMEDWHGVSDAANDIRELDSYKRGREDGETHSG